MKVRVRRPGGDIFKSMLWWTWKCPKKEKGRMLCGPWQLAPVGLLGSEIPMKNGCMLQEDSLILGGSTKLGGKDDVDGGRPWEHSTIRCLKLETCIQDGYGSNHLKQIMTDILIPIYRPREKGKLESMNLRFSRPARFSIKDVLRQTSQISFKGKVLRSFGLATKESSNSQDKSLPLSFVKPAGDSSTWCSRRLADVVQIAVPDLWVDLNITTGL